MTSEELIQKLEDQDLAPRSYSGRGMFGDRCVGVAVRSPGDYQLPPGWTMDQLGLGLIVYWPTMPWPAGRQG